MLSDQLKWLPNGSELISEDTKPNTDSKPKTFTSFSCSQDSLPEFSSNPPGPRYLDIIIDKLGPGQVTLDFYIHSFFLFDVMHLLILQSEGSKQIIILMCIIQNIS